MEAGKDCIRNYWGIFIEQEHIINAITEKRLDLHVHYVLCFIFL